MTKETNWNDILDRAMSAHDWGWTYHTSSEYVSEACRRHRPFLVAANKKTLCWPVLFTEDLTEAMNNAATVLSPPTHRIMLFIVGTPTTEQLLEIWSWQYGKKVRPPGITETLISWDSAKAKTWWNGRWRGMGRKRLFRSRSLNGFWDDID